MIARLDIETRCILRKCITTQSSKLKIKNMMEKFCIKHQKRIELFLSI